MPAVAEIDATLGLIETFNERVQQNDQVLAVNFLLPDLFDGGFIKNLSAQVEDVFFELLAQIFWFQVADRTHFLALLRVAHPQEFSVGEELENFSADVASFAFGGRLGQFGEL